MRIPHLTPILLLALACLVTPEHAYATGARTKTITASTTQTNIAASAKDTVLLNDGPESVWAWCSEDPDAPVTVPTDGTNVEIKSGEFHEIPGDCNSLGILTTQNTSTVRLRWMER